MFSFHAAGFPLPGLNRVNKPNEYKWDVRGFHALIFLISQLLVRMWLAVVLEIIPR